MPWFRDRHWNQLIGSVLRMVGETAKGWRQDLRIWWRPEVGRIQKVRLNQLVHKSPISSHHQGARSLPRIIIYYHFFYRTQWRYGSSQLERGSIDLDKWIAIIHYSPDERESAIIRLDQVKSCFRGCLCRQADSLFRYIFVILEVDGNCKSIVIEHWCFDSRSIYRRYVTPKFFFQIELLSCYCHLTGTTDTTRTWASILTLRSITSWRKCQHFGTPTAEEKRAFTRVLQGHIAIDTIVFPDKTTGEFSAFGVLWAYWVCTGYHL